MTFCERFLRIWKFKPKACSASRSALYLNIFTVGMQNLFHNTESKSSAAALPGSIRVYPVNSFQGETPDRADNSDSPGLSGITRVIIAVQDLDHAMEVYGKKLAMSVGEHNVDDRRGVRSAICKPASGGVIELVSVEDKNRPFAQSISGFLEGKREGMYALVLQSGDPQAAQNNLNSRGLNVTRATDSPDILQIKLEFGVLIRIEPA